MSGMIPGMEVYCVVTYGHNVRTHGTAGDCNPTSVMLNSRERAGFRKPFLVLFYVPVGCIAGTHTTAGVIFRSREDIRNENFSRRAGSRKKGRNPSFARATRPAWRIPPNLRHSVSG